MSLIITFDKVIDVETRFVKKDICSLAFKKNKFSQYRSNSRRRDLPKCCFELISRFRIDIVKDGFEIFNIDQGKSFFVTIMEDNAHNTCLRLVEA